MLNIASTAAVTAGAEEVRTAVVEKNYAAYYITQDEINYYENLDGTLKVGQADKNITKADISETVNGKKVTSIGNSAFSKCKSLTSVTTPNSVRFFGEDIFYGDKDLKDIYYDGTEQQWQDLLERSEWDGIIKYNIYKYSVKIGEDHFTPTIHFIDPPPESVSSSNSSSSKRESADRYSSRADSSNNDGISTTTVIIIAAVVIAVVIAAAAAVITVVIKKQKK